MIITIYMEEIEQSDCFQKDKNFSHKMRIYDCQIQFMSLVLVKSHAHVTAYRCEVLAMLQTCELLPVPLYSVSLETIITLCPYIISPAHPRMLWRGTFCFNFRVALRRCCYSDWLIEKWFMCKIACKRTFPK